jgi:N-acetylglucosamine-6-phosphate deacetylase
MARGGNKSLLLRNANLVLPDRRLVGGAIQIEAGRIARIFDSGKEVSDADSYLDLMGLTLYPGFIDIHIHGAVGFDVNSASADELRRVSEFLARNGVTSWLPTLVPAPAEEYKQAVDAIGELMHLQSQSDGAAPSARVLGVHYEGPFVNSEQCGALHRQHFRTFDTVSDLDALPMIENENAIHMMTIAPEIAGGIELISELKRRGWIVSIGHTRATSEVLDRAKEAGAHHMTHFMNAMSPLHQRAPGPVGWGLLNDEVGLDMIADGIHLDPMMLKVLLRCVTPSRLSLISDAIAATGEGEGEYEIWGEKITVQDGRTRNARGNIAGSVITMLDAVKTMRSFGVSECDAARMASLNPAQLLGIDQDCGSIEAGKRGDLVALNDRGHVQSTLVGGQVAFDVGS